MYKAAPHEKRHRWGERKKYNDNDDDDEL